MIGADPEATKKRRMGIEPPESLEWKVEVGDFETPRSHYGPCYERGGLLVRSPKNAFVLCLHIDSLEGI